jgi:hypothetical protein
MARAVLNVTIREQTRPDGLRREASGGAVRLSWPGPWRWICAVAGSLGLVTSLVVLTSPALYSLLSIRGHNLLIVAAGVSVCVLVAAPFQRVVITMDKQYLAAFRGPLPSFVRVGFPLAGSRRIPTIDVYRIWLEPEMQRDLQAPIEHRHDVWVMTIRRGRELLLAGLSAEQARYAAQEMSAFLGLDGQDGQKIRIRGKGHSH